MPRNLTRRMMNLLNAEDFLPVVLLEVQPIGSVESVRLSDAGEAVTWNGNPYYPMNLSRGNSQELVATDTGNIPAFSINIQNIDKQMAALLGVNDLDGAGVTLRLADRRLMDRPRDAIVLMMGEARDIQLSESVITFSLVNVMGMLEQNTLPRRLYQQLCNYAYGSQACTVDRSLSPNTIMTTTQAGTTSRVIIVPSSVTATAGSTDPSEFWGPGVIVFADGPSSLAARPIQRVDGPNNAFYVRLPFSKSPGVGSTCYIRRGCDHTKPACQKLQVDGTADNFGGYEEVPYGRIIPVVR